MYPPQGSSFTRLTSRSTGDGGSAVGEEVGPDSNPGRDVDLNRLVLHRRRSVRVGLGCKITGSQRKSPFTPETRKIVESFVRPVDTGGDPGTYSGPLSLSGFVGVVSVWDAGPGD